ncbi:hypothetical protein HDU86_000363 [Geranomyces michiganensis]|nr:hypothetical protein HDU86_000363 [Geranomyces michiganensis]
MPHSSAPATPSVASSAAAADGADAPSVATAPKLVLPLTYAVEAAVPQTPASVYLSALPSHHPHHAPAPASPSAASSAPPFPPAMRPPTPAADSAPDSYFSLTPRPTPNPTSPGGVYEHLVCPLCFTLPHRMKLLPCCGNRICAECAAQWVKTHPSCPFCRADLDLIANASVVSFKDPVGPVAHDVIHIPDNANGGDLDDGHEENPARAREVGSPQEQSGPPAGIADAAPTSLPPSATPTLPASSASIPAAGEPSFQTLSLTTALQHPSSDTLTEQDPSAAPQQPPPSQDPAKKKRRRRIMLPDDLNMQAMLDDIPVLCPFADSGADQACDVEWVGGCKWKGRKARVRDHLEADCIGILDPKTHMRKIDIASIHFLGVDSYPTRPEEEFLSDSDDDENANGLLDLRLPPFVVANHDPNVPTPIPSLWASPVRVCVLFSTALALLTLIVLLVIQRVCVTTINLLAERTW